MTGPQESCFHCGLPVPPQTDFSLTVDGRERRFCCNGCCAVCQAIVASGLGDFYRHRTAPTGRPPEVLPDELPREGTTVLHCQTGWRAAIDASLLQAQGISNVVSLKGGIQAWVTDGRPVERSGAGAG